jgi:Family of unknown function (DUF5722)
VKIVAREHEYVDFQGEPVAPPVFAWPRKGITRLNTFFGLLLPLAISAVVSLGMSHIVAAQVTTPYPSKSVYQMKSVQPDVQSWGAVGGSLWNANVSELVGNQAAGVAINFQWDVWEATNHSSCTGTEVSFQGHCYAVDSVTDSAVQTFASQGLAVTGVLYGTPSWANSGKTCAGSVWCSPNSAADYARFVQFIANRYNGANGHGRVVDFVIHNEVNEQVWYNCGCSGAAAWEQDYANNYNAAYDAVQAEQTNARVLISQDHVWSPALDNGSTISVSEFLPAIASRVGTRNWMVAFHPYSNTVGGTTFSPDDINAGYITFGDIGVLVAWLQHNYPGSAAAAHLELTESGFDTAANSESAQKTAVCNSFFNVVGTPGIDNYVYHHLIDNPAEGGLLLGLWRTDQSQKPSWGTWALSNRSGTYACGFGPSDTTTLTRSYNSSRGHWASSRLAPSGFNVEHQFQLLRSASTGTSLLYECQIGQHNMVSNSVGCEGLHTNLGPVGYIHNNPGSGLVTLYRCHMSTPFDHFISTDPSCEGQFIDYVLGYAEQLL